MLLLPPAFKQAAIKALHEDTHAGQQQTIKMARDRYILPGMGRDIKRQKVCQILSCLLVSQDQQAGARQARQFPKREDLI